MKRCLVVLVAACLALAGCTGGGKHAASPSSTVTTSAATTTATPTPATTTTSPATASAPATTSAAPSTSASSGPSASAAATTTASPAPLVGPLTVAKARATVTAIDKAFRKAKTSAQRAKLETCAPSRNDLQEAAVLTKTSAVDPYAATVENPEFVAAAVPAPQTSYPQSFLVLMHYAAPKQHYQQVAAQVYVRTKAGAAWRECYFPYLLRGRPTPVLAKGGVVPAATDARSAARATNALKRLASFLTKRAVDRTAQAPSGLAVPFNDCKPGVCAQNGMWDPHFTDDSGEHETRSFTVPDEPVFRYPLANGHVLAIGVLHGLDTFRTKPGYWYTQDKARSPWGLLVPPGDFTALTRNYVEQIALDIAPDGKVALAGTNYGEYDVDITPR
jgi:hypothetical protein